MSFCGLAREEPKRWCHTTKLRWKHGAASSLRSHFSSQLSRPKLRDLVHCHRNPVILFRFKNSQLGSHFGNIFLDPMRRTVYNSFMRVISRRTLKDFYATKGTTLAKGPCEAWYKEATAAAWSSPQDIKNEYPKASVLSNNRVVFDLGGNKYRLVVAIHYKSKIVYVRFIGTHAAYDKIDAEKV